jgi:RNA polymerase subunit RPABC4/transcription elongation factor Spt4
MPTGLPDPVQLWDQFINNPIVGLVGQLIVLYAVLLWLGTAYWAFRDMQARTENPIAPYFAAALIIFFTPVVFLAAVVLYLIVRPRETLAEVYERSLAEETLLAEVEKNRLCPTCRYRVGSDWLVCPNCRTRLHRVCPACNHLAEPEWGICAYCGTDLERSARPAARPAAAAPVRAGAASSVRAGAPARDAGEMSAEGAGLRSATNG